MCARLGLKCIVYMGAKDMERQALNVFRMRLMGAEVRPVYMGTATLKDATSEAIRDWVRCGGGGGRRQLAWAVTHAWVWTGDYAAQQACGRARGALAVAGALRSSVAAPV